MLVRIGHFLFVVGGWQGTGTSEVPIGEGGFATKAKRLNFFSYLLPMAGVLSYVCLHRIVWICHGVVIM